MTTPLHPASSPRRARLAVLAPMLAALALSQPAAAARALPDFTDLVEQVGPSVVNIRTLEKVRTPDPGEADAEMQEFFRRFFGVPMPNIPRQAPRPTGRSPAGSPCRLALRADRRRENRPQRALLR